MPGPTEGVSRDARPHGGCEGMPGPTEGVSGDARPHRGREQGCQAPRRA